MKKLLVVALILSSVQVMACTYDDYACKSAEAAERQAKAAEDLARIQQQREVDASIFRR